MKKCIVALLILATTINTQGVPISASVLQFLYTSINNHAFFSTCRQISYVATVSGSCYLIARFLNGHRNAKHDSTIEHTSADQDHPTGSLTIVTDGFTTIKGFDPKDKDTCMQITTEDINPDTKHYSLFDDDVSQKTSKTNEGMIKRFFLWLLRPAHRKAVRQIISVPRQTNIVVHSKNSHALAHPDEFPIIINGIHGSIQATADSGNIRITRSAGKITTSTSGHIEVLEFSDSLNIENYRSYHVVRADKNESKFKVISEELPIHKEYTSE